MCLKESTAATAASLLGTESTAFRRSGGTSEREPVTDSRAGCGGCVPAGGVRRAGTSAGDQQGTVAWQVSQQVLRWVTQLQL